MSEAEKTEQLWTDDDWALAVLVVDRFWLSQVARVALESLKNGGSCVLYPPTKAQYQEAASQLAEFKPKSSLAIAG